MYTKPLSYSGKKLFAQCPRRWHSRYVLGVKEPQGKAAERGEKIHHEIELFFTANRQPTHSDLLVWRRPLEALTVHKPSVETEWAVTAEWQITDWNSPEAFYRGKPDLHYATGEVYHIKDWKTGRVYDDHPLQGETYVALAPPGFSTYRVEFWYIDQPLRVETYTYNEKHRALFTKNLTEEVHQIRAAEDFPPTPSDFGCKYCPLSWRNGGKCDKAR